MRTICHLCGATVDLATAKPLPGLPGCAPLLYASHERPDGRGKCRVYTGLPLCCTDDAAGARLGAAATLSVAREAPESAE